MLLLALSVVGLGSILAYVFFLRGHLRSLYEEVSRYGRAVVSLNEQVQRNLAVEGALREQLDEYRRFMSRIAMEGGEIVDFDLAPEVGEAAAFLDSAAAPYRNLQRGPVNVRELALTFDLGTGRELDYVSSVLRRTGVRATLFLSNEMPSTEYGSLLDERNLDLLAVMADMGCELGNHTWSHFNLQRSLYETSRRKRLALTYLSDQVLDDLALRREFLLVEETLRARGIPLSKLWRAPYGAFDRRILAAAAGMGYTTHVMWSGNRLGPLDFYDYVYRRWVPSDTDGNGKAERVRNPHYYSSAQMLERLKQWEAADPHGFSGAVAVAHLGTARKSDKIIRILPEFISYCHARGYRFVTVSELMGSAGAPSNAAVPARSHRGSGAAGPP